MSDGVTAAVARLSLTVNSLPLGHAERWGIVHVIYSRMPTRPRASAAHARARECARAYPPQAVEHASDSFQSIWYWIR
jgi:enoyl-CoA hydratase/carnithine racemase